MQKGEERGGGGGGGGGMEILFPTMCYSGKANCLLEKTPLFSQAAPLGNSNDQRGFFLSLMQ